MTLQDVAREADVAVSTVSRALSNPDRVSRPMRERIQEVARRLGYTSGPDAGARLHAGPHGQRHRKSVQRRADSRGGVSGPRGRVVIGRRRHRRWAGGGACAYRAADRSGVDGIVLASSLLPEDELRAVVDRADVVLFNREVPGFASVITDSRDGSRQIVEHLAALGHRSIAYLSGPPALWTDTERWRTLSDNAARLGVEIVRLGPFMPTLDQGTAAADVGLGSGATALVAFNDLLAIGILQRLRRRKVDVPGAISVVGHDDIFGADFCQPSLTTVRQRRRARRPNAGRPGAGPDRQPTGHPDRDSRPNSWCGNRRGPSSAGPPR